MEHSEQRRFITSYLEKYFLRGFNSEKIYYLEAPEVTGSGVQRSAYTLPSARQPPENELAYVTIDFSSTMKFDEKLSTMILTYGCMTNCKEG